MAIGKLVRALFGSKGPERDKRGKSVDRTPGRDASPAVPSRLDPVDVARQAIRAGAASGEPAYRIVMVGEDRVRGMWIRDPANANETFLEVALADAGIDALPLSGARVLLRDKDFRAVDAGEHAEVLFGMEPPEHYSAPDSIPLWSPGAENPVCPHVRCVQGAERIRFDCATCGYPMQAFVHDVFSARRTSICDGCGNVTQIPSSYGDAPGRTRLPIQAAVRVPIADFGAWYFAHPLHGYTLPDVETTDGLSAFCAACKRPFPADSLAPLAVSQRADVLARLGDDTAWMKRVDYGGLDRGACAQCGCVDALALRVKLAASWEKALRQALSERRLTDWYRRGHLYKLDFLCSTPTRHPEPLPDITPLLGTVRADGPMDARRSAVESLQDRAALEALLAEPLELSLKLLAAQQLARAAHRRDIEKRPEELARLARVAAGHECVVDAEELGRAAASFGSEDWRFLLEVCPQPSLLEALLPNSAYGVVAANLKLARAILGDDRSAREALREAVLPCGAGEFADEFDLSWQERVALASEADRRYDDAAAEPFQPSRQAVVHAVLGGDRDSATLRAAVSEDNTPLVNDHLRHLAEEREGWERTGLVPIAAGPRRFDPSMGVAGLVHGEANHFPPRPFADVPRRGRSFLESQAPALDSEAIRVHRSVFAASTRDIAESACRWNVPTFMAIDGGVRCLLKLDSLDARSASRIAAAVTDGRTVLRTAFTRRATYPVVSVVIEVANGKNVARFEAVPDIAEADVHDAMNGLLREGCGILHLFVGPQLDLLAEGYFTVAGRLKKTLEDAAGYYFHLEEEDRDYRAAAMDYLRTTSP